MTHPANPERRKKKPSSFDEIYTAQYAEIATRILAGEVTEQGGNSLSAVLQGPEKLKGIEVFTEAEVNEQIAEFTGQFSERQCAIFESGNFFIPNDLVAVYDDEKQTFLIRKGDNEPVDRLILSSMNLTDLYMPLAFLELEVLLVGDNGLDTLPLLPNSVTRLLCAGNRITYLPELPLYLEKLDCHINEITNLPKLPATLTYLSCGENQLTSLPDLSVNLERLWCANNRLTTLPLLPPNIREVHPLNTGIIRRPAYENTFDQQTLDMLKARGFIN